MIGLESHMIASMSIGSLFYHRSLLALTLSSLCFSTVAQPDADYSNVTDWSWSFILAQITLVLSSAIASLISSFTVPVLTLGNRPYSSPADSSNQDTEIWRM